MKKGKFAQECDADHELGARTSLSAQCAKHTDFLSLSNAGSTAQ